jgi:Flp pilus assembly protein TadD
MHRMCLGILGMVLAVALVGCGGESTVEEGSTGFTPTDTRPLDPMIKQMQEADKTKAYLKKPEATEKEKKEAKKG